MKRLVFAFLSVVVAFALTGCSAGDDITESESGEGVKKVEQVEKPNSDDLEAYFDAFASDDAANMEEARSLTFPRSAADTYLVHQASNSNARIDGGQGSEPSTVSTSNRGYKLCEPGGKKDTCTEYDGFKSKGGKLSGFKINGEGIAGRLTIGTGKPISYDGLGSLTFVSAYRAASNNLFVNFDIKSLDQAINIITYDAKYRAPDGRQSTATMSSGPSNLGPESKATISIVFEKAKPGGQLTISLADESFGSEKSKVFKIG